MTSSHHSSLPNVSSSAMVHTRSGRGSWCFETRALEPGANGGSRKGSAILTAASRKTSTKDASGLADLEAGPGVSRKVSAKFSEVL